MTRGETPGLTEIATWTPTIDVEDAAQALGVSRAHAYAAIKKGEFPVQVLLIGKRLKVLTASLLRVLETGRSECSGPIEEPLKIRARKPGEKERQAPSISQELREFREWKAERRKAEA